MPRNVQARSTKLPLNNLPMHNIFQRLESVNYLLDEAFLDIEAHFSDLLTAKWQSGSQAIDTVCATLDDYFEDYQFLKPSNFELVISCAQDRVARKYITAMLQNNLLKRKITFTSQEERKSAAVKIFLQGCCR